MLVSDVGLLRYRCIVNHACRRFNILNIRRYMLIFPHESYLNIAHFAPFRSAKIIFRFLLRNTIPGKNCFILRKKLIFHRQIQYILLIINNERIIFSTISYCVAQYTLKIHTACNSFLEKNYSTTFLKLKFVKI